MKCFIPFRINCSPINKLAIIPFEKNPDRLYTGLELQYLDSNETGSGYRVIAYRTDNYVDVYDDDSLIFNENEKFGVALNGLNKHVQTDISNVRFEKIDGSEVISFSFSDIENRSICFEIEELSKKKTTPMNLLAPIGYGSKNPDFLPLFFMYDFDFIRKGKTVVNCTIDEEKIKIDTFPAPMDMQFRYYARYSPYCELLEFAYSGYTALIEAEITDNTYALRDTEYIFDSENSLKSICVNCVDGDIVIEFVPSFDMNNGSKGSFTVCPKSEMGYMSGEYEVQRNGDKLNIRMTLPDGWISVPKSFIAKKVLNKNSIFCCWSKKYEYLSEINISEGTVNSKWINHNRK